VLLNYALAVLTGLLLVLIHPRTNVTILAPFAIAPLVYALVREWVPKHRFLLGYTAGIVYWAGINYWIHFVISVHGGLGSGLGAVGFVLFVLLRAIPLGVFGLLAGVLVQRPYAMLGIPALWVGIERLPWLFYYTWLHLGNAGIDMPVPMRLAPFTGVYGLSYVFATLGTAIALLALGRLRRQLVWAAPLLALVFLPGLPDPERPTESVVSVQPNIPERDDWTQELARSTQQQMEFLSMQSALSVDVPRTPLILWPEVPAPVYYLEDTPFRERVNKLAKLTGAHILIGTVAHNERGAPLNAALMISPNGEPMGRYDKMFPVPFGEYIPFPFKGLVSKVTEEIGDFEAGTRIVLFDAGKLRVGPFICYESAFPHLVRQFVAQGATVLANLSNDGYFGGSAAREQHLSLVRMRAAENRRWILRSTNDGITASIDPAGRIVRTFSSFRPQSGRLPFTPHNELTFYSRYGDVFAWGCAGIAGLLLVASQLPGYRRG
jgi:apolipoprotein N-acyltransferase